MRNLLFIISHRPTQKQAMMVRSSISSFLIVFLCCATSSCFACKVPPAFWCDSLEISSECGVTEQCRSFQQSKGKLVNVALYYETLCPGCRAFIKGQLTPAFHKVGSIMNITLVPYGNAKTHTNTYIPGGHWFTCQHGSEECVGNKIETCAMYYYPNVSVYFPFVSCVEASKSVPRLAAPKCASDHNMNYTKIYADCVDPVNPLGVDLENTMGMRTNGLQPPHQYVPWITLNGVHTNEIQNKAMEDLVGLVCSTYTGSPKPQACSKSFDPNVSVRK